MPGAKAPEPEYVAARRVLLDAYDALGAHRNAVVLVGAQAIYLHVGEGDLAVTPYTTDADLAIDPRELDDEPELRSVLAAAGFKLTVRPGTWSMSEVQIDFMVPASLGGPGRRGARLGVHGSDFARKATGLEAAVVDHSLVRVGALDTTDNRWFDVRVAGLAALVVAKLHKIAERKDNTTRLQDKDGLESCACSGSLRQRTWARHSRSWRKIPLPATLRDRRERFSRNTSAIAKESVHRWLFGPASGSKTPPPSPFPARSLRGSFSTPGPSVRLSLVLLGSSVAGCGPDCAPHGYEAGEQFRITVLSSDIHALSA